MVKADIKKKDGTHIVIEGSEKEVKKILTFIQADTSVTTQQPKERKITKNSKMSIADMLHELKEERFFDKPRSLIEIKNALSEKGRIYEVTTLSAQVLRQVRKRSLGRIKKEDKWMYVKR
jgi:hypothetical protein